MGLPVVTEPIRQHSRWDHDRIADTLADLGYDFSAPAVGNILKRRGLPPAPDRQKTTTWKDFIRRNLDVGVVAAFFPTLCRDESLVGLCLDPFTLYCPFLPSGRRETG